MGLNIRLKEMFRKDDFEQISKFILEVCERTREDYELENKKLLNNENHIRTIMLERYMRNNDFCKKHQMSDYRFDAETPENYDGNGDYIGRADVRVVLKTDFTNYNAYYLIECKRIDGTLALNKKYIDNGILRFTTQYYSSYYSKNIMLGFVVRQVDLTANSQKIEDLQNSSDNKILHGDFQLIYNNRYNQMYTCIYNTELGKLELRHIFSDISEVTDL